MPITLAKSVSIVPKPSTNACLVSLFVISLMLWGVTTSDFPVSVSFSFFGVLGKNIRDQLLFVDGIHQPFLYKVSGVIEFVDGPSRGVERVSVLYASWFLIVIYQSGERQLLWRDSCEESDYRYLIVSEKRRYVHLRASHGK
ncbi:hypothetical protein [Vibrio aerogenes]|uniref:hypothetical protein n=1 Tax=Vibrio aerogenes TaxID=92172 RepID=UPI001114C7CB|nr:hypothetical protein [Vibrio aerogenes]